MNLVRASDQDGDKGFPQSFTLEAWAADRRHDAVVDFAMRETAIQEFHRVPIFDDYGCLVTVIRRPGPVKYFRDGKRFIPRERGYSRAHWRIVERDRLQHEQVLRTASVPSPSRSTVASWDRPLSDVRGHSR